MNKIQNDFFYVKVTYNYPPFKNGDTIEEYFLKNLSHELNRKYIPALWTNMQTSKKMPINKLQTILNKWIKNNPCLNGYFTIVQHDDGVHLNLPKNTIVYGCCTGNVPIPLIYEDKNNTLENYPKKKFSEKNILCSFVGSITHNIRQQIYNLFHKNNNFYFVVNNWNISVPGNLQNTFLEVSSKSKFALAPRGYGRASFRFYELLQIGTIPIYIYDDIEWLPFKNKIDYNKFCISIHFSKIHTLEERLLKITEKKYNKMLEEYHKIKNFFTLEGTTTEIFKIEETNTYF
jgi:hypothetical protein